MNCSSSAGEEAVVTLGTAAEDVIIKRTISLCPFKILEYFPYA